MQLEVIERLNLLNILPREGDFTTIKIVRELREALSFSEEEHAALKFVQDGSNLSWQPGVPAKEIKIGRAAKDIVVRALRQLDEEKALTVEHLPLWEKFIGLKAVK